MKREGLASRYSWLFLLVAQPDYFFDLDAIRRPYIGNRALSRRRHRSATRPHTARGTWPRTDADAARGSNPGNVWSFSEQPGVGDNRDNEPSNDPSNRLDSRPGVLVEMFGRCIAAGCPPGGLVLDPFPGSSRAAAAAVRALGRAFTGPDSRRSRSVRTCRVP
jgi:site-specific DNA-methyltransferase (cytosine-N4-specific)